MIISTDYLKSIIAQGEGMDIEFKESQSALAQTVYETICSFLNRKGGHILLGVSNDGTVKGVIYDRNQDGDFKLTNQQSLYSQARWLYRKQGFPLSEYGRL